MTSQDRQVSSYDNVAYPSYPHSLSHPDHLATIGCLAGLSAPPTTGRRVLELGCGEGGNLLPLVETMTESHFVGVDASEEQIEKARAIARTLQYEQVRFECADLLEWQPAREPYDVIVCHGVFSWTTEPARQAVLRICGEALAPHGLALINYNTYPGWFRMAMVRDLLRWETEGLESPQERVQVARRAAERLRGDLASDPSPYAQYVCQQLAAVEQYSDAFLFHSFLNVVNRPLYLHEFVKRAADHGLRYVGDADLANMFRPRTDDWLQRPLDDARHQQRMDYQRGTTSRYSILCRREHGGKPLTGRDRWASLYFAGRLWRDTADVHGSGGVIRSASGAKVTTTDAGTLAMLLEIGRNWPGTVAWSDLERTVHDALGGQAALSRWLDDLQQCLLAGIVQPRYQPPFCSPRPPERPCATRLARYQARHDSFVTNLWHQVVRPAPFDRQVLANLDGTRSVDQIAELISGQMCRDSPPESSGASMSEAVNSALQRLHAAALLCGAG